MKTTFTFTRQFFVLLFFVLPVFSRAQHNSIFDANNFSAGIGERGMLFYSDSISQQPQFMAEVPKGGGTSVFYYANLILSGLDEQGKHHFAANSWQHPRNSYYSGPIAVQYDSLYDNLYSRNFKVTRQQVDQHRAQLFPTLNVSNAIRFWPARGNPHILAEYGIGITQNMAPFVDVNTNNYYDPANGDYPAFCGDQAIFFVFNDERASHDSAAGSNHLGIEIRAHAEQFLLPGEALDKHPVNNAMFVHYEVENKSASSYSDLFVSMNLDPDVGCFSNDAIGCDTNRHLAYAYNRTGFDMDCQGIKGYHNLHTAGGVQRLDAPLSSFGYFIYGGTFNVLNSDSSYYYALRGKWADGVPYTEGGTGRDGTVPTRFIYPGTPTDLNTWSEVSAATQMGDRRFLASSGPVTFAQGQVKTFDYAFFASYDSTATNLTIADTLRRDADVIQAFYNSTVVPCRVAIGTGITKTDDGLLQVSVYPNPASSQLAVETPEVITRLQVTNMLGQVVIAEPGNSTKQVIDVSGLAKGIYLLKVKAGDKEAVRKIVLE